MMFQMLSVFAEFERAIRERILAGLRRTTKKSGRKPMPKDRQEAIRRSCGTVWPSDPLPDFIVHQPPL